MSSWGTEAPWVRGGLELTSAVVAAVEADACRGYAVDEEACGYLAGAADAPLRCDAHVALQNVANKLHAVDPERYFRTARTFFSFNEKKFGDAFEAARASGRPIKVLYHSHLDAGAYFSPTDAAVMSMGEPPATEGGVGVMGPGPAFPLAFLVVAVGRDGERVVVRETRLFVWEPGASAFVPSSYRVVPS